MLQRYSESNFKVMFFDYSRFSLEKKLNDFISPFLFIFLKDSSFCFKFCNIVNMDFFYIQRFFLVLWLFTGCFGFVSKYKSQLRLGKFYYHFLINYTLKKNKFLFIISFILDDFLKATFDDGFFFDSCTYVLFFKDLDIFTNKKLARGVYFYRVQKLVFFNLNLVKKTASRATNFLNSIKLQLHAS